MTSEIADPSVDAEFAQFAELCVSRRDHQAVGWDFANGDTAPPLVGEDTLRFGPDRSGYFLHDPYRRRIPRCFNLRLLRDPTLQIGLQVGLIIDSNAADRLRRHANDGLDTPELDLVLSFLAENQLRPSPVFYLLESLAKATDLRRWQEYSESTLAALTILDERLNLSPIDPSRDRLIDPEVASHEALSIKRSYAALLYASVLNARSIPFLDKVREFTAFLQDTLRQRLSLEILLAFLHWSSPERFSSMMTPIQRGSNPDRALSKLRSTSWDLYLVRLPEQLAKFLVTDVPEEAAAVFQKYLVLTADRALAEFMAMRSIELVIQSPDRDQSRVFAGPNAGVLLESIPADERDTTLAYIREWELDMDESESRRVWPDQSELEDILREQERLLRLACAAH